MKHRTAELDGPLLDVAVALAEGWRRSGNAWARDGTCGMSGQVLSGTAELFPFHWSSDWKWGGPIIERERIMLWPWSAHGESGWWGCYSPSIDDEYNDIASIADDGTKGPMLNGPTPLVAAMRAYVASKFGDEVDLP